MPDFTSRIDQAQTGYLVGSSAVAADVLPGLGAEDDRPSSPPRCVRPIKPVKSWIKAASHPSRPSPTTTWRRLPARQPPKI